MAYYTITNTYTKEAFNKEFASEQEAHSWVERNMSAKYIYTIEYNYQLNTPN